MEDHDQQAAAFAAAARRTRLTPASVTWARAVLVDGQRVSEVAKAFGVHRQAVSRAVARIRAELLRDGACPLCGARISGAVHGRPA